ncbi:proteinase-activated receptor 3-like [Chiroxiphia lanceolata]|uniref:proteinase-activated receptor 3-like n=1 Tax=Chiroxiphia lanceolata TaxID=296741 RepID=UPI0013CED50C|nr:proteinase-activated receptor 3-like [Chiroxiphia lanceolata]
MSQRVPSPGCAAACVTLLLSCAWLGSATQPSPMPGKGRSFIPLTPREKNLCPGASEEAFLNSTLSTLLLPALYSVVLLVGLPANALACWVLATNFRRCSSTLFLLNLAGADLLFVLLLPFKISYHLLGNHWLFGDYLCRTMVAFFYGNMYSSVLFLTCIGLERYISVAHPFLWKGSSWTRGKVGICVGIWLVVGAGMSPLLLHSQTQDISSLNITTCHDVLEKGTHMFFRYYFLSLVGLGFGLPFVLMTISYSCILARLLAKGRCYGQVVRVLALVLLVFILCFTPSNVLLFIHYMLEPTGCHNITYFWYALALVLSAFNNCFDPFIYFYISQDFRGWVQDARGRCLRGLESSLGRSTEKTALPLRSSEQSQGVPGCVLPSEEGSCSVVPNMKGWQ